MCVDGFPKGVRYPLLLSLAGDQDRVLRSLVEASRCGNDAHEAGAVTCRELVF